MRGFGAEQRAKEESYHTSKANAYNEKNIHNEEVV